MHLQSYIHLTLWAPEHQATALKTLFSTYQPWSRGISPVGKWATRVPARLQTGGGPSEVYTYLPLPAPLGRYVLKAMENYLSPTHPPNFYLSTTVKVSSLLFKSLSVANTQLKLAFLRHENFLAYVTWKFKEVTLTSSPSGAHVHPLKQSLWL